MENLLLEPGGGLTQKLKLFSYRWTQDKNLHTSPFMVSHPSLYVPFLYAAPSPPTNRN
jgi:hypothetical protein